MPVRIKWSTLLLLWLVWPLGVKGLPEQTGAPVAAGVVAAVVLVAGLIAGILAHELAHVLAARRNGINTVSVTLHVLGGAARFEHEALTPGAEAKIAAAGPAASLLLGLLCGVPGALLTSLDSSVYVSLVGATLFWMGAMHVALGLLNSVPAYPLDGGRVLRAVLWKLGGDRHQATVWAAAVGRFIGIAVLVAWGLGFLPKDLMVLLGGLMLITAASSGLRAGRALGLLASVPAKAAAVQLVELEKWTTVQWALEQPDVRRHGVVLVRGAEKEVVGFVTIRQLMSVHPELRISTKLEDLLLPVGTAPVVNGETTCDNVVPMLGLVPFARVQGTGGELVGWATMGSLAPLFS